MLEMSYFQLGEDEKAEPALRIGLRANPKDDQVEMMLAHILINSRKPGEAVSHLNNFLARSSKSQEGLYLLGKTYLHMSEDALKKINEIDPNSVVAHEISGKMDESMHNYDLALVEYKKAIDMAPMLPGTHMHMGNAYWYIGKWESAQTEFTAGAAFQRLHADEPKVVASDYVMLGDYGDADKWFTAAVAEKPEDADTWYLLGRTKFNEDDFGAAISSFERALALNPKNVEAENNLGLAWLEANQPKKAQAAFQNAIDWQGDTPVDAQPFLNLGTLLADQKSFDKAILYLAKAATLSKENPKIHEELAQVYGAKEDLPRAQSELEMAVALAPGISGLHFKLGQIYRKEGLQARAQQEFQICAQLNSTHSSVATPNPPR